MDRNSALSQLSAPVVGLGVVALCWGAFGALVPDIKARIGASDALFGLLLLIATTGALSAMWLSPRLERRAGSAALPLAAGLLAAAMLLPGLAVTPWAFAAAMVLVCVGSGATDVLANARTAAVEASTGRAWMALVHALYSFAYAAAALVTGLLRQAGWSPGAVLGLMAAVAFLGLLAMRRDGTAARATGDAAPPPAPLPRTLVLAGGTILLVAFMAEQAAEGWSALHLERGLGASAAMGALGPAILGLTMGLGRLLAHWAGHRTRPARLIVAGAVLAAIGACVAAAATAPGAAYLGFAALGLGVSVVVPMTMTAVAARVAPELRTVLIARVSVIGYAGFFMGPPIMGGLAQLYGLPVSFLVLGVALAIVPAALIGLVTRLPRHAL